MLKEKLVLGKYLDLLSYPFHWGSTSFVTFHFASVFIPRLRAQKRQVVIKISSSDENNLICCFFTFVKVRWKWFLVGLNKFLCKLIPDFQFQSSRDHSHLIRRQLFRAGAPAHMQAEFCRLNRTLSPQAISRLFNCSCLDTRNATFQEPILDRTWTSNPRKNFQNS